jgi:endoribonuclease Dicer
MLNDNPPVRLSPHLLFQAVTRRSANEMADMENLEILGDCFLKLGMSMALYHKYPEWNAGKLTPEKDWQVSNANLYKLAIKKELQHYLFAKKIQHRGKEANWLPPGYTIDEANSEKYLKQTAKRKAFADMVEALIGAFLVSTDYSTTLKYMKWLGLGAIPENEHGLIMKTPSVLHPGLSETMDVVNDQINQFISERAFTDVENSIRYTFKNKAYLLAAFTHPSYSSNQRITQCYDRYFTYINDNFNYLF